MHKKEGILSFETIRMDLEGIMLSEISQRERHKQDLIYVEYTLLSQTTQTKNSQALRYREQTATCQRWSGGNG